MVELISQGQTTCAGCGMIIAVRLVSKACPKNVIVSCATSCLEVTTSAYPLTAWNVPWIHTAFETASSTASGIEAAIKKLRKNWKVLAIAGDGGTFDIGFQALSGMLERGHKVTQVCVDNEAYMNTGIQRSGATPFGAWTTTSPPGKKSFGKTEVKKPILEIVAAHKIPYAASASIAYPQDLIQKVKKAFEKQPSFIHIHCPCPPGWKFPESDTISVAKLAVETGMWILYEIEDGKFKINIKPKRKPVKDYLQVQGRFKHLGDKEIQKIQAHVDSEWERLERLEKCGRIF
ncbi:MAG: pyruvate synthase subunit beta [Candidatus Aenigmatarchaeota archaeon]|nr:MAG: pyruvate synthase subunit beta [Candidatus Aenigmarchaeota archaeon]